MCARTSALEVSGRARCNSRICVGGRQPRGVASIVSESALCTAREEGGVQEADADPDGVHPARLAQPGTPTWPGVGRRAPAGPQPASPLRRSLPPLPPASPLRSLHCVVLWSAQDVIGIAETGSGKTCAFVFPMLVYISRCAAAARPPAIQPHLPRTEHTPV